MDIPLVLDEDRLFPSDARERSIARELYDSVKGLPIISPHGHTDPAWFADNECFPNPTELLIKPDHYVFRMLYSQGVELSDLGLKNRANPDAAQVDPRDAWRLFAEHYYLFRATPSRTWLDYVFKNVFSLDSVLSSDTADHYYDTIEKALGQDEYRPRQLFERFNIEVLATTESPLDDLAHHRKIMESDWQGRVITAFRSDNVVDPEHDGFNDNVDSLGKLTSEDVSNFKGYLNALRQRREFFKQHGATSSDHGHPTPATADLSEAEAAKLYQTVRSGGCTRAEAELFRAQMLTEMAKMSIDDGLVMQIHPGSYRNHNQSLFENFGRDKGADIPLRAEFVENLRPLLSRLGNSKDLEIILFTLDETNYSREIAPLVGHYPSLKAGPAWWFHDSPEGMKRFREQMTETAGFYNTVGFNDDTRAFLSIPARHDVARRCDCAYLAGLVNTGRLSLGDAQEVAVDLTYNLAKKAYHL
ncbi:glucuronate isomerase [Gilvimarinus agarilyticus]|uniref:glucuronate isomerase n=1 Tax=Gilvimarinus sp. 2_MG-2023 TaxID=3062666 RepID=UPI001C0A4FED|nr:glucuronate isomerase [Gilvimarinus sp. 2_MG-2023]MBU2886706.1 glucuronate isomerase [Gilvimarinus agarilyticus]MDO6571372.1 glucuronate isomerase [Gilvimarinus sp. 2_MG-2023]